MKKAKQKKVNKNPPPQKSTKSNKPNNKKQSFIEIRKEWNHPAYRQNELSFITFLLIPVIS